MSEKKCKHQNEIVVATTTLSRRQWTLHINPDCIDLEVIAKKIFTYAAKTQLVWYVYACVCVSVVCVSVWECCFAACSELLHYKSAVHFTLSI